MTQTLEGPARDLVQGKNFAHLAVSRPDGTIQSVVVWVDVDDDGRILVNSAEGRSWPKNLRRNGGATVSIHNPEKPYEFVSIVGKLVEDTHDGAEAHIDSLAKKYMGKDEYPWKSPDEVRVKFALSPERVTYRG